MAVCAGVVNAPAESRLKTGQSAVDLGESLQLGGAGCFPGPANLSEKRVN